MLRDRKDQDFACLGHPVHLGFRGTVRVKARRRARLRHDTERVTVRVVGLDMIQRRPLQFNGGVGVSPCRVQVGDGFRTLHWSWAS